MSWNKLVVDLRPFRKERLRAIAKIRGLSISQVVRDLIDVGAELYRDRGRPPTPNEVQEVKLNQCYAYFLRSIFGGELCQSITVEVRGEIDAILSRASFSDPLPVKVFRCRCGFDDGVQKTLQETADIFGLTRERVRQQEAIALRRLRHPRFSASLRQYVEYLERR